MEIIEKTRTYLTRRQRDRRLNHLFTIDINFPKLASPVRIRSHVDFFTLPTIRFQDLVRIPGSGSRPKADRAFQTCAEGSQNDAGLDDRGSRTIWGVTDGL
jgi:hypothetical protein